MTWMSSVREAAASFGGIGWGIVPANREVGNGAGVESPGASGYGRRGLRYEGLLALRTWNPGV